MAHKFFHGIPPSATRVFKGVLFEVWQWEQELFDGTTKTFEVVKRKDYVEVIPILENGNIVMLEQQQPGSKPFYSFPGGRVDEGETPERAARRELKEEAGVEAEMLILRRHHQPNQKYIFEVHEFIGRNCRYIGTPTETHEEKITLHEVSFEELIELASREDLFRGGGEQRLEFLRAKYDSDEREKLRSLLFGQGR